mgnify:FL=1
MVAGYRLKPKPAILGALLAIGTFQSSALVVGFIIIAWALCVAVQNRHIPTLGFILWASLLTPFRPIESIILGAAVLSLVVIVVDVRRNWSINDFVTGLLVGSSLQVVAALTTWGSVRPGLWSLNASIVGQVGLMFWLILPELPKPARITPWIFSTILIGVSVARFPLFVAGLFTLFRPGIHRTGMFLVIVGVFLAAAFTQGNLDRLDPERVQVDNQTRVELLQTGHKTGHKTEFQTAIGYGIGQFINETGLTRPHNVFVLLFYELGYLVIVPAGLFAWAIYTRRVPLPTALSLIVLWQLVEEPGGQLEGMFISAVVFACAWRRPSPWPWKQGGRRSVPVSAR